MTEDRVLFFPLMLKENEECPFCDGKVHLTKDEKNHSSCFKCDKCKEEFSYVKTDTEIIVNKKKNKWK